MGLDQAAGLRRMFAQTGPRLFTFVASEIEGGVASTLFNLGGALRRAGSRVMVVDALAGSGSVSALVGVDQRRTILDGLRLQKDLRDAVDLAAGLQLVTLRRNTWGSAPPPSLAPAERSAVESALRDVAADSDIVLIDGCVAADGTLVVGSDVSVQVVAVMSANADSLKQGYGLLKRLITNIGPRRIAVILTGADERTAAKIFENLARAAGQYLAVELIYFGAIPNDPFLAQADSMRRAVVEAFPQAIAATAFRQLAEHVSQIEHAL